MASPGRIVSNISLPEQDGAATGDRTAASPNAEYLQTSSSMRKRKLSLQDIQRNVGDAVTEAGTPTGPGNGEDTFE